MGQTVTSWDPTGDRMADDWRLEPYAAKRRCRWLDGGEHQTLRADRLSEQRFKAIKGFVTNTIMFVIALALFGWHWRWLRRPAP